MIGWLSLGLNSSGSEELQHWNDMRAARQPTQVQRWHSLLRPWNIWSWKSFCYKTTFHVNDYDMVWSMEHGTDYSYSCTPWYMTDRVAKQLNFSRWMRLRSIGCRLYCPNRTKKSIYWSVDPVNQSCHNLACGNSEFKIYRCTKYIPFWYAGWSWGCFQHTYYVCILHIQTKKERVYLYHSYTYTYLPTYTHNTFQLHAHTNMQTYISSVPKIECIYYQMDRETDFDSICAWANLNRLFFTLCLSPFLGRVSIDGESSWDTQPSREPIMNRDPLVVLLWTS